ncbi:MULTISPECIES: MFS transporter [Sphingobacterium]|uniref:MFS transporter n=1 Tax=Sphingobacterium TaxID=28453 RepID=UPI0013DBABC3|nr:MULTISPECIES: MFS transporter [unclassified Sphingobacterium]
MYWIPTTWFAMGLPFVAVSGASSIMYKNMGVSDTQIAFWTSLIMIPWTLKPLWGPFLELYKTKKFFVYITQIFTGILFGLVGLTLQLDHFFSFSIAILTIIALSGATHDTAADGVYLNELSAKEQAKYVGWQGAFYNVAKVFSGGALVYLAGQLEREVGIHNAWMIVMFAYGGIMLLLGFYNMRMLPSTESAVKSSTFKEGMTTLKDVIITFFQKKHIWFSLAFIVFYRFAEGQAIKIIPLFFKSSRADGGLELSTSQIGLLYGVFGAVAFVLGSIVAGNFIAKSGLNRKSLLILCTAFNIPFAAYAFLAVAQPENLYIIGSAVVVEYFGYGFGFVGLILFIMQNIAPGKYKMAHYAFGSGLVNLGFMIPSMISGWLSDMMGYREFFIWVMIATIPAFIVTWLVPLKKPEELEEVKES